MYHCARLLALVATVLLFTPVAQAATIITSTPLSGAAENPSNGSTGQGTATVTLDTTAHQLRVNVVFSGLGSNTTAAHIHCCTSPPGNVGVATTMPAFAGFPLGVTSGALDQTYDTTQASTWNPAYITNNGGTTAGAEAALAAGLAAGQAYLNIHTSGIPAGEIRGFLIPQSLPNISNIPTLSEWTLGALVVLLAAGTWMTLRRRGG